MTESISEYKTCLGEAELCVGGGISGKLMCAIAIAHNVESIHLATYFADIICLNRATLQIQNSIYDWAGVSPVPPALRDMAA